MTQVAELRSGKGHRDENFPVASHLIQRQHRPAILAFYNFVRTADDIADHAELSQSEKLALLDKVEDALLGRGDEPVAVALREELKGRGLSPRHAQDLLTAFRMDVTKLRYRDWDDLIHYCSYSAMPVGRFVLDVHGESHSTWTASDALCAALQIINHLQDCANDYLQLDRVYVPEDALAAAGTQVEALGRSHASPQLLSCLHGLAQRTETLLEQGAGLALEIAVIHRLAARLVKVLQQRDPLRDRVHLGKGSVATLALSAIINEGLRRPLRGTALSGRARGA
jgi:squalene synthase HpnC